MCKSITGAAFAVVTLFLGTVPTTTPPPAINGAVPTTTPPPAINTPHNIIPYPAHAQITSSGVKKEDAVIQRWIVTDENHPSPGTSYWLWEWQKNGDASTFVVEKPVSGPAGDFNAENLCSILALLSEIPPGPSQTVTNDSIEISGFEKHPSKNRCEGYIRRGRPQYTKQFVIEMATKSSEDGRHLVYASSTLT